MKFLNTKRLLQKIGLILLIVTSCLIVAFMATKVSHAADPVIGFNPGKIIEDAVFTNTASMDVSQIQSFLNSKVPACDTWGNQPSEFGGGTRSQWGAAHGNPAPFTCLRDYSENGLSAAQIIYNTAQKYQINPQVFIVLLQKEQGLITDTWPLASQYRTATGYGCPDTAACDTTYYGFTNQLKWSGTMFRAILNNSQTWYSPYVLGTNYIQWNPQSSCGGSTVNIENRSTQALYDYTPYRPNQTALNAGYGMGDGCSAYGNRNFYLYFRDWFGYNSGPAAFTVSGSSTIYIPVDGYKMTVPYMAALQDYGVSTDAIQTVSQGYVDAMPSPPSSTGISAGISSVVKSPFDNDEDGASVYLISRGKRYKVQSMQQLYNMGIKDQDISYLPLSYIFSKDDGGILSSFVSSPYGNIFQVSPSGKQVYFEYNTYIKDNPSDQVTPLSYYLVDKIPSGNPITDKPILIKYSDSEAVSLYIKGNYFAVPDFNTFTCWGLQGAYGLPVYRISQNNYISTIVPKSSLSCITNDGQTTQVLNGVERYNTPPAYGLSGTGIDTDLKNLQARLPLRSNPLKQYVKGNDSAAVWYIDSNTKRLLPTYAGLLLLGLSDGDIDTLNPAVINTIPTNGIKLADGQIVKDPSSSAIYAISGNGRILYPSSDLFLAYKNSWDSIETYSSAQLNQYNPFNGDVVSDTLVDKVNNQAYIMTASGCFRLSNSFYAASGLTYNSLAAAQTYSTASFKNIDFSRCTTPPNFIKESGQSLVYWLDNGQKHPLVTYQSLLNKNNGTQPTIITTSSDFLTKIPTGTSY